MEKHMNFSGEMKQKVNEIEAILDEYLPAAEGYQKQIMEAMAYSVTAGGKRLRPMLMQETFRLFGGEGKVVEPFMAALEMIHTYSLIHDDLPAMDNDDLRRGRPTCHKAGAGRRPMWFTGKRWEFLRETHCSIMRLRRQ